MPDPQTHNTAHGSTMPRREFIRKSLIASGGAFVGMATVSKVPMRVAGANSYSEPASSKKETRRTRTTETSDSNHGINRMLKTAEEALDN